MAMLRRHSNNSNIRLPEVPPESAGFRCETSPLDGDCELPISAVIFAVHGDTTQTSSAELTRSRATQQSKGACAMCGAVARAATSRRGPDRSAWLHSRRLGVEILPACACLEILKRHAPVPAL